MVHSIEIIYIIQTILTNEINLMVRRRGKYEEDIFNAIRSKVI